MTREEIIATLKRGPVYLYTKLYEFRLSDVILQLDLDPHQYVITIRLKRGEDGISFSNYQRRDNAIDFLLATHQEYVERGL